jgi:glyoxylase I family protein
VNPARPNDKLPYRGAWLWVGSEMIHLMELPNPDPLTGRPEHGGRDRHTCIAIKDVLRLKEIFDKAGMSQSLISCLPLALTAMDITLVSLIFHHHTVVNTSGVDYSSLLL